MLKANLLFFFGTYVLQDYSEVMQIATHLHKQCKNFNVLNLPTKVIPNSKIASSRNLSCAMKGFYTYILQEKSLCKWKIFQPSITKHHDTRV